MQRLKCIVGIVVMAAGLSGNARASSLLPINTDTIKRSVVFIFGADATGEPDKTREVGTGFIVEIPLLNDATKAYLILVTARHIVDPMWACAGATNPTILYARLNNKTFDPKVDQSGVDFVKVPLVNNGHPTWRTDERGTIDAAVVAIDTPKFQAHDLATVKLSDFATDEEAKAVSIGDDIVSAGLVPNLSGQKRNYPFFKFGKVSSLPDEDTLTLCPGRAPIPKTLWYVAATLIPGNSGSPIFVLPPGDLMLTISNTRPFLIGLQSSSLIAGEIAGMTPSQYIFDIIKSLNIPGGNLYRGPTQAPQKPK